MGCSLKPFWRYYGGKWRVAPRYPEPVHSVIVEPFAGAAGYSLRYADRDVILVDKSQDVVDTWRFLIKADPLEIRAMPARLSYGDRPEDFGLSRGATLLLRWWCNMGSAAPCRSASRWASEKGWNESIRERIAQQVSQIRHWRVIQGDYTQAPDVEATWFVDPPYVGAGKHYAHGDAGLDFGSLAAWCRTRRGAVVVCENTGADWLPFRHHLDAKANESATGGKVSREAIWTQGLRREGAK